MYDFFKWPRTLDGNEFIQSEPWVRSILIRLRVSTLKDNYIEEVKQCMRKRTTTTITSKNKQKQTKKTHKTPPIYF